MELNVINRALEIATKFIGTKEEGQNTGPVIDEIQKKFGFHGVQYCVLFTLYCYKQACEELGIKYPFPQTASSQTLFDWALKNKIAYTDTRSLTRGDIVIWRKFKLWQGHAGLVISSFDEEHNTFKTIEGNTANSDYGNQRDGDGIYIRRRFARKIDFSVDNFYLRGFINVKNIN